MIRASGYSGTGAGKLSDSNGGVTDDSVGRHAEAETVEIESKGNQLFE